MLRVCIEPDCPRHTTGIRCDEHRKQFRREQRSLYARNKYPPGWERFSRRFIQKHPSCECRDSACRCGGNCTNPSSEVDHVVALVWWSDPKVASDESNLAALCKSCHASKTKRVDRYRPV